MSEELLEIPAAAAERVMRHGPRLAELFGVGVRLGEAEDDRGEQAAAVSVWLRGSGARARSLAKGYILSLCEAAQDVSQPPTAASTADSARVAPSESAVSSGGLRCRGHRPLCRSLGLGGDPPLWGAAGSAQGAKYQAKVEFALKLGYGEAQVQSVLAKLGEDALTNDLLGELIRLQGGGGPPPLPSPTPPPPPGGEESDPPTPLPPPAPPPPLLPAPATPSTPPPQQPLPAATPTQQLQAPPAPEDDASNLRPIVIDGSNVAMSHGNKEVFSCRGILLAVSWFRRRGHRDVTVFVPSWRKEQSRPDAPITDQSVLSSLEREGVVVLTPSRRVQGRRVVCYDDRFIVRLAHESGGVIVSNDHYRDLQAERPEWRQLIEQRLLMYSFVNDKFMPPDDPLGRHGPSLDNFLRRRPVLPEGRRQPCPYGKKCTYGAKCKFLHPERGAGLAAQRSLADELRDAAARPSNPDPASSSSSSSTSTSSAASSAAVGKADSYSSPPVCNADQSAACRLDSRPCASAAVGSDPYPSLAGCRAEPPAAGRRDSYSPAACRSEPCLHGGCVSDPAACRLDSYASVAGRGSVDSSSGAGRQEPYPNPNYPGAAASNRTEPYPGSAYPGAAAASSGAAESFSSSSSSSSPSSSCCRPPDAGARVRPPPEAAAGGRCLLDPSSTSSSGPPQPSTAVTRSVSDSSPAAACRLTSAVRSFSDAARPDAVSLRKGGAAAARTQRARHRPAPPTPPSSSAAPAAGGKSTPPPLADDPESGSSASRYEEDLAAARRMMGAMSLQQQQQLVLAAAGVKPHPPITVTDSHGAPVVLRCDSPFEEPSGRASPPLLLSASASVASSVPSVACRRGTAAGGFQCDPDSLAYYGYEAGAGDAAQPPQPPAAQQAGEPARPPPYLQPFAHGFHAPVSRVQSHGAEFLRAAAAAAAASGGHRAGAGVPYPTGGGQSQSQPLLYGAAGAGSGPSLSAHRHHHHHHAVAQRSSCPLDYNQLAPAAPPCAGAGAEEAAAAAASLPPAEQQEQQQRKSGRPLGMTRQESVSDSRLYSGGGAYGRLQQNYAASLFQQQQQYHQQQYEQHHHHHQQQQQQQQQYQQYLHHQYQQQLYWGGVGGGGGVCADSGFRGCHPYSEASHGQPHQPAPAPQAHCGPYSYPAGNPRRSQFSPFRSVPENLHGYAGAGPSAVGGAPQSPPHEGRERVFQNLCAIFPGDVVWRVMERLPGETDPVALATAIVAETRRGGGGGGHPG